MAVIVLMSDGSPTVGSGEPRPVAADDAGRAAGQQSVSIDTIAGTSGGGSKREASRCRLTT
jgi:hypothetical protein